MHDHDHTHAHDHDHGPGGHHHTGSGKRLGGALVLASLYLVAEVVGGLWTGSLALLADAGHMLSDVAALALSLGALWLARRPPTAQRTFGYYRAEILAALVNGTALVVIGVYILLEARERWSSPPAILGGPMLAVATGGLVVNLIMLALLHGGDRESLNVRGAFLHVVADALGSVGAILAGLAVWLLGWRWADPVASSVIALLIIGSAVSLLRQTVAVLMQAAPARLDMAEVRSAIEACHCVVAVHDIHAWTLSGGRELLSAHVVVGDPSAWAATLDEVRDVLRERYALHHVTLQPEIDDGRTCHCTFG